MGGAPTKHDIPTPMYKTSSRIIKTKTCQTSSQPTPTAMSSQFVVKEVNSEIKKAQMKQQVQRNEVIQSVMTDHNSEIKAPERKHTLQSTKQTGTITFKAPDVFKNGDDFFTNWFEWKCQFLTYIKGVDCTRNNRNSWGILLLNRMGPVGQEIWKSFVFINNEDKDSVDTLIPMFDKYCAFHNVTKKNTQSIDEYVTTLKEIADARNINKRENVIREKILKEVDHDVIKQKLRTVLPFLDCTLDALPLQQLITVWKMCEQSKVLPAAPVNVLHSSVTCETPTNIPSLLEYENPIIFKETCPLPKFKINCRWCGLRHVPAKFECPAMSSRCIRCNRIGHFRIKCDS